MTEFARNSILVFLVAVVLLLSSAAGAIDTTYDGVTATWDVSELSDLTYYDNPSSTNFRYSSRLLSPAGNDLSVTVTVPKESFRYVAMNYIQLWSGWGSTKYLVAQIEPIMLPDPVNGGWYTEQDLVLSVTFSAAIANSERSALLIKVSATPVYSPPVFPVYFYIRAIQDPAVRSFIGNNPDDLGGEEENSQTGFDDGEGPGQCPIGLPNYSVNTAILNPVVQDTDFAYRGLGPAITFTRTWNAVPANGGMFGRGWSFTWERSIRSTCAGAYSTGPSGQVLFFQAPLLCPTGGGPPALPLTATPPMGNFDTLTLMPGDFWILEEKDSRLISRFDLSGTNASGHKIYRLESVTDRNGNAVALTYNSDGTLADVTDAAGRQTSFGYDGNLRCTSMTMPDGVVAAYDYDASGNLVSTIDRIGTVIDYTYDFEDFMTSLSADGHTATIAYTGSGEAKYVTSTTDPVGNTTTYARGSIGPVVLVTDARGFISTYVNWQERTTSVIDSGGNATNIGYDSLTLLPTSVTDPLGHTVTTAYDVRGNLTTRTDPQGNATFFSYDGGDDLLSVTNALGQALTFAYDANHNLTSATSALGATTTLGYDVQGLLTSVIDPNENVTTYGYDSFGNVAGAIDPLGHSVTFEYDAAGINRTRVWDAAGFLTTYAWDGNRRLTDIGHPDGSHMSFAYSPCVMGSMIDALGNVTALAHDLALNLTGITNPLGASTLLGFDSVYNRTAITDATGAVTGMAYDSNKLLWQVTDPLGGLVTFWRDEDSRVVLLVDEMGYSTSYGYDARDLPITTTNPLGQVVTVARDGLGRVSSFTNARGNVVSLGFDAAGRLTSKSWDGVVETTLDWDQASNLVSRTDGWGTTTYAYSNRDEVTGITYPDGTSVGFSYDANGNVQTTTYPGGVTVTYTYDNRNRVTNVAWDSQTIALTYDLAGNLLTEARSNGTSSTYTHNANGLVTTISHKTGATPFAQIVYGRNALGNTISESSTFLVDPTLVASSEGGSYDAANQVITFGGATYGYDLDGNLATVSGAVPWTVVHDPENLPTTLTIGGATTTYTYDGIRNRVSRQRGATTRFYHYDHYGRLLFETDAGSGVVASYFWTGEKLAAMRDAGGSTYFYHFEKMGTTIAMTDGTGNIVNAYAYDPYGRILAQSGALENPFTFVGAYGVMSEGDGVYYMRRRYYDATTSRFLERDPIGIAGGINLYRYVGNNPVNAIDPSGTDPKNLRNILDGMKPKGAPLVGLPDIGFIFTAYKLAEGKYQEGLENLLPYNLGDILGFLRSLGDPDAPPAYRVPLPEPIPEDEGFAKCSIPHTIYK